MRVAEEENAVIPTYDTDFGELVFQYSLKSRGVILLRLGGLSLAERVSKTIAAIGEHEAELENAFTVISENSIRIRKSF